MHLNDMSIEEWRRVDAALFARLRPRFSDLSPLDFDYAAEAMAIEAELTAGVADSEMHRLMAEQCREIAADDGDQGFEEYGIGETAED